MEQWIKSGIKKLIADNAATLVSGITIQGVAFPSPQVTKELISPPAGNRAYCSIDVPSYQLSEYWVGSNLGHQGQAQFAAVQYDVVLELVYQAFAKVGETQLFEGMGADWDKFTDRLVKLLWMTTSFQDAGSIHTFKLADSDDRRAHRRISVENGDLTALAGAGDHPIWYRIIRARFNQDCVDLGQLT